MESISFELVMAIIGIILPIVFFVFTQKITVKHKKPIYIQKSYVIALKRDNRLKIFFKDTEVANLFKTTIRFWNEGKKTIRGSDLLKDRPFSICINDGFIVEYQFTSTIGMEKTLKMTTSEDKKSIIIEFDAMQRDEGFLVELLHASDDSDGKISIRGDIDEAKIRVKKGRLTLAYLVMAPFIVFAPHMLFILMRPTEAPTFISVAYMIMGAVYILYNIYILFRYFHGFHKRVSNVLLDDLCPKAISELELRCECKSKDNDKEENKNPV
jgi:hypothetical protein